MSKFVRVHPYDPARGFKVKQFVFGGQRFLAERGWYEVSDALAAKLALEKQNRYNEDSKPVFQIATEQEAKTLSVKDLEEENPEISIQRALDGAQTVNEEKLDETAGVDEEKSEEEGEASSEDGEKTSDEIPFG